RNHVSPPREPLEISNHGVVASASNAEATSSDFPPTPPLTECSHFVLMAQECAGVDAPQRSKKSKAETAALVEAEVDEAIATCGGDVRAALRATLIANAYLEAEIERLSQAISTGFARGRMRKAPQRVTKI